jgi:hypothetical protein
MASEEQFYHPYNPVWKPKWLRLQELHAALPDPLDKVTIEEHLKYAQQVVQASQPSA